MPPTTLPRSWLFSDCIESLKNTWAASTTKRETAACAAAATAAQIPQAADTGPQAAPHRYGIELRVQMYRCCWEGHRARPRLRHKLNLERDIVIARGGHPRRRRCDILAKFFETGCEVVFAAEYFCWPRPEMKRAPPRPRPTRPARVPGNCGRPFDTLSDDQPSTPRLLQPAPSKKMCIDYKNDLFMCMGGALQVRVARTPPSLLWRAYPAGREAAAPSETGNSKVEVENVKTKGRPKIMHFNGGNLKPHVVSWYQQMYGIELDPADGSPLSYPGTKIVALLIAVLGASSSYWYCRKQRRRHVSYPP
eukprot:tig00000691_g3152.t1